MRLTLSLTAGLSAFSGGVSADHGGLGFGLGTASPIITDTGVTLPDGMWAVGMRTQFISFDRFSNAKLMSIKANAKDEAHGDVHSVDSFLQPSLFAAYGVTDNLSVGLRLPANLRFNVRQPNEDADHVANLGDPQGIGDTSLFGQYRFFNTEDNLNHVSLLTGLKMPTGDTSVRVNKQAFLSGDAESRRFETHHQPGSGSWDPLLGLAYTRGMGPFSFDTSFLYTFVTQGEQETNLGDIFNYNFALSYAVGGVARSGLYASSNNSPLTLVLEFNGEWRDRQKTDGVKDPNSGNHTLFISPGIRYAGGSNWNVGLSVGAPIINDSNGFQTDPDYRIVNRIALTF